MIELGTSASVGSFFINLFKSIPSRNSNHQTKLKFIPESSKRYRYIQDSKELIVIVQPSSFIVPKKLSNNIGYNDTLESKILIKTEILSRIRIYNKSNNIIDNLIIDFKKMNVFLVQSVVNGEVSDISTFNDSVIRIESLNIDGELLLLVWHKEYFDINDLKISHSKGRLREIVFTHEPISTPLL